MLVPLVFFAFTQGFLPLPLVFFAFTAGFIYLWDSIVPIDPEGPFQCQAPDLDASTTPKRCIPNAFLGFVDLEV